MFESFSQKFLDICKRTFSGGHLTEKNIEDGLQEVRNALLEADANVKIVDVFIDRVKARAIGEKVIKNIRPDQQIIKIVGDELTALMGPVDHDIVVAEKPPTIIMMVGLQGSGKTTTCAKLANRLQKKGHKPLLVAADIQRPAAVEQLKILGESIDVPVFTLDKSSPPEICKKSVAYANKQKCDLIILDTAGRLHIDKDLMDELRAIQKKIKPKPHNIFFVCDAMTGQDAVNSAKEFNAQLELDGIILTKLDGDTRGGAALSIKAVTGKPIKFIGVGEKIDNLDEFHPERMASRILGMGDVRTLVDKAEQLIDEEEALKMQQKLMDETFSFEDFLGQLQMLKKMGSFSDLLGMLPGNLGAQMQGMDIDEKQFARLEGIIHSMTPDERQIPEIIDGRRRARIAKGSGVTIQEVNQLLRQFRDMRKMMSNMGQMSGMMGNMMGMGDLGLGGRGRRQPTKKKKRKKR